MNKQETNEHSSKTHGLYHFTNEAWLPPILVDGIKVPTQNTTEIEAGVAPEALGVWLTDESNPSRQQWKLGSVLDKTAVHLTVEVPGEFHRNLRRWRELATELGVSRASHRAMDEAGGYGARHWLVYRAHIPPAWIRQVTVHGRVVDAMDIAPLWKRRRVLMRVLVQKFGRLPADLIPTEDERHEFSAQEKPSVAERVA